MGSLTHDPDLFQEGALGLTRAAQRFDPNRGLAFSTYAHFWIRAFIGRAQGRHHLAHVSRKAYATGRRPPRILSIDRAPQLSQPPQTPHTDLSLDLDQALTSLPKREQVILRARYLDPTKLTHRDLSKVFHVSFQRVAKIEQKALQSLAPRLRGYA